MPERARMRFVKRWRKVTVFGMRTQVTQALIELEGGPREGRRAFAVYPRSNRYVLDVWRMSKKDERTLKATGTRYVYQVRATVPLLGGAFGRVLYEGRASTLAQGKVRAESEARKAFARGD